MIWDYSQHHVLLNGRSSFWLEYCLFIIDFNPQSPTYEALKQRFPLLTVIESNSRLPPNYVHNGTMERIWLLFAVTICDIKKLAWVFPKHLEHVLKNLITKMPVNSFGLHYSIILCLMATVAYNCHSMKQLSWVPRYKTAIWPMTKQFSNLTYDKTAVPPMKNLQLDLWQNNTLTYDKNVV